MQTLERPVEAFEHLLRDAHLGVGTMRALYARLSILPTSTVADTVLIRSWLAYHRGSKAAERATIAASRGHSYRIDTPGLREIVRISDYYDHRDGVAVVSEKWG